MNTTAKIFTLISIGLLSACQSPNEKTPPCPEGEKESDAILMSTLWLQTATEAKTAREQAFDLAYLRLEQNNKLYTASHQELKQKTAAVVLDLDETVLDNSPYEARVIKNAGKFEMDSWSQWVEEAQADLIPGAEDFLQEAMNLGLEIYYISNRSHERLGPTLKNMQAYKLPFADSAHVFLRKEDSDKSGRRAAVDSAHKIILIVGDQMGDFAEAEALEQIATDSLRQHFVLIPNPMYGSFTRLSESEEAAFDTKLAAWREKLNSKNSQEWGP